MRSLESVVRCSVQSQVIVILLEKGRNKRLKNA